MTNIRHIMGHNQMMLDVYSRLNIVTASHLKADIPGLHLKSQLCANGLNRSRGKALRAGLWPGISVACFL